MTEPDDHNDGRWLVVRYLDKGEQGPGHDAGWYVMRVCPCHFNDTVTLPYPTQARAERVRLILLGEITTPSWPRQIWQRAIKPRETVH